MRVPVPTGVAHKTKQEFVYQALRQAIMRCELAPGQRLVIQRIAEALAVSPIPVREALQLLQAEGLVTRSSHVGATVAGITNESVIEIFLLKEGLETVASRLAAQSATGRDIGIFQRMLTEMDGALERGHFERWGDLNTSFHSAIVEVSGMPMLQEMTSRILDHWNRIRHHFFKDVLIHRLLQSQREHYAIVRAIRNGDGERAEWLARQHNQGALNDYLRHIEEKKEQATARIGTEPALQSLDVEKGDDKVVAATGPQPAAGVVVTELTDQGRNSSAG